MGYSNEKKAYAFDYRGFNVELYQAVRKAEHCGVEHETDELKCRACGASLDHTEVFLIAIMRNIITDMDMPDQDTAVDVAQGIIDTMIDCGASPEDLKRAISDTDPKKDDLIEIPIDVEDDLPALPPHEPSDARQEEWRNGLDIAGLANQMGKLGWPARAAAIVNGLKIAEGLDLAGLADQMGKLGWAERAASIVNNSKRTVKN